MLPPGDIRNCIVALSEDEALLSRLFQHRFVKGSGLEGHSFGNLFLAALTEVNTARSKLISFPRTVAPGRRSTTTPIRIIIKYAPANASGTLIDGGAAANGASAGDRSSAAGGIEVVLLRDMRMTGLYFL